MDGTVTRTFEVCTRGHDSLVAHEKFVDGPNSMHPSPLKLSLFFLTNLYWRNIMLGNLRINLEYLEIYKLMSYENTRERKTMCRTDVLPSVLHTLQGPV